MNEPTPPPAPGLSERGSAFWREIHATTSFQPHDTAVVIEACRTLDVIESLAASIDSDGLYTSGSMGQKVLNPAIAELRQQQAAFARLMSSVSLPERDKAKDLFLSRRAHAGADARWKRPVGLPSARDRLRAINGGSDWMKNVTIEEN